MLRAAIGRSSTADAYCLHGAVTAHADGASGPGAKAVEMPDSVRVLIVDDEAAETEALLRELRREGFEPEWWRVDTESAYLAALDPAPDVVVADYSTAQLGAERAVALLRRRRLDVPVIVVCDSTAEEIAASMICDGAADYVLKDRLARLGRAVRQALEQRRLRDEKTRAEETLERNERYFRTLIENTSDFIVILDAEGKVRYSSPSVDRGLGYSAKTFLGRNAIELTHSDDQPAVGKAFDLALRNPGKPFSAQYRFRTAAGSWRTLESVAMNLLENPAVRGVVVNSRDITDRERTEEALRRLAERLKLLHQIDRSILSGHSPRDTASAVLEHLRRLLPCERMSVFEFDGNPPPRATVLAVYPPDPQWLKPGDDFPLEALGRTDEMFQVLHQGRIYILDQAALPASQPISAALAAGRRYYAVVPLASQSGLLGVLNLVVSGPNAPEAEELDIVREVGAQLAIMLEQARQRENIEEAARADRFSAEVALALATAATLREMLTRCADSVVSHLDAAFGRIWVLNPEENVLELVASAGMYTHLDGDHARIPLGKTKIGRIAAERQPYFTNSLVGDPIVEDPDWARREGLVAFASYPLLVGDRLVGVGAIFSRRPFSNAILAGFEALANTIAVGIERKLAEENLRKALKRAEESDRLKTAFLANVSHEVRTPLNVILGYNDLLRESFTPRADESELELFVGVEEAGERLINTVTGILDLSKLETGTFERQPAELRPQELIPKLVERFRRRATKKGLSLSCEIEERDATIVFDEYCFSRALFHLVDNAVKFTLAGSVSVRLFRAPDRSLVLQVGDTGVGIAEEYVPKLFRPFSQEESSYTRSFEGPGIGLALTKRLVEINGGRLEFESRKNVGSVFAILLPESKAPADRDNR